MGFYLYHNKKDKRLEIGKLEKANLMVKTANDEVEEYNLHYFICNDRKLLKDKAISLKEEWTLEIQKELEAIKSINIKNKY